MTSDTPTDAAAREQAESSTPAPARKPARRRATRAAAAPTGPAAEKPVEKCTTKPAEKTSARATKPAAEPAAAPVEPSPEAASSDAASSLAGLVLPERAAARDEAPAGTSSLADIVLPEGPAGRAADDAAQKPARTRRRATRSAGVQPAAEAPEPVAPEPVAEAEAAPATKGRGRAASGTRARRTAAPVAEQPDAAPVAAEGGAEQEAAEAPEKAEPAPAKKAPRKAAARKKAGSTTKAAAAEDQVPADAAAPTAEQSAPRSPAARGGGSVTPRLATTAVLFQAPDMSARRSRRAQAPAGPPRPHEAPTMSTMSTMAKAEEPATARDQADQAAKAAKDQATTAEVVKDEPATRPAKSSRSRRSTRASKAEAPEKAETSDAVVATEATPEPTTEVTTDTTSPATSPATEAAPSAAELSEDEAAAVEEVGVIESELVAEGVELVDLGPEDLSDEDGEEDEIRPRRRRRRGGRGRRGGRRPEGDAEDDDASDEGDTEDGERTEDADRDERSEGRSADRGDDQADDRGDDQGEDDEEGGESASGRRRRRRRRGTRAERAEAAVSRTRDRDEVTALKGSTRLEAKRQRRREGRDAGRRRQIITEAEFLARRESVTRSMVVRERDGRTQIAVLEDGVLVEHYVSQQSQASMVGNVYLGRVQNVLPSMEAAFVDVGKGRNAVLYAGEVNWDAAGLEGGQPRRIEEALKSGDSVLVQVTKDPIGHKGARLTSQVTLAGRYLVFVPGGGMTGISRKLPDTERSRLKKILRDVVPDGAGVIVRTAAEGASEAELRADVERLEAQWASIQKKSASASAPALLQGEPDLAIRVVRDIFNDDFSSLQIQGDAAWGEISEYVDALAPDLRERVTKWTENTDVFAVHRVDEQLAKGMDRKVWLPSGGSLVIDRTEAMTVVDVNTGKFTGAGGTLEETVTRNNLEAAEEIVRQLRLRDIGGIVVIDFIDMVLESNRDLVLRRLVECLGRDRTKHQVAEVTSLGLVQMTRKRVGQGLVEAFSETCEHCKGRGFIVHSEPIEKGSGSDHQHHDGDQAEGSKRSRRKRGGKQSEPAAPAPAAEVPTLPEDRSEAREAVKATLATIAAAAAHAHEHEHEHDGKDGGPEADAPVTPEAPVAPTAPVAPETLIELPERTPEPAPTPEPTPTPEPEPAAAEKPVRKAPRRARKGAGAPSAPRQDAGQAAEPGVTGTE
ncbi:Rne/Rng family ribonuclease [Promicromonospora sp. Marseille-Q5078]